MERGTNCDRQEDVALDEDGKGAEVTERLDDGDGKVLAIRCGLGFWGTNMSTGSIPSSAHKSAARFGSCEERSIRSSSGSSLIGMRLW